MKHKNSHTDHFVNRGYNRQFISTEFEKCNDLDRISLIGDPEISFNVENKESGRRVPLVLDFHPSYAGATKAVNKYKHLLDLDDSLKEVVSKDKIFVTFRKARTIGDSLVHSRYSRSDSSDNNTKTMGNINCGKCNLCKFFLSENTVKIKSLTTKLTHNINQSISFEYDHVIYVITDLVCNKQNVGSILIAI